VVEQKRNRKRAKRRYPTTPGGEKTKRLSGTTEVRDRCGHGRISPSFDIANENRQLGAKGHVLSFVKTSRGGTIVVAKPFPEDFLARRF